MILYCEVKHENIQIVFCVPNKQLIICVCVCVCVISVITARFDRQ